MKTGDTVIIVSRIYSSGHIFSKVFETREKADAWIQELQTRETKATIVTHLAIVAAVPNGS